LFRNWSKRENPGRVVFCIRETGQLHKRGKSSPPHAVVRGGGWLVYEGW